MEGGSASAGLPELVWLIRTTARNQARSLLRQLKRPRYLMTAALGVAYFAFLFLAPFLDSGPAPASSLPEWVVDVAPFGVAAWLLISWVRGGYRDSLAFTASETAFLFPAPLRRSTLIRYKLLRAQLGIGVTVLFGWFFTFGGPLPWYMVVAGFWVTVTTLYLHQLAASLTRVTVAHGGGGLRRVAVPVVVGALVLGAVGWSVAAVVAELRAAPDLMTALAGIGVALDRPLPRLALYPFRAIALPVLATDAGAWLAALPPALVILAVHYVWVVRTDAAFEEAAAEAGAKRARIQEAVRAGKSWWRAASDDTRVHRWIRPPLLPTGEPALALLWKHVLGYTGSLSRFTLALAAVGPLALFGVLYWASESVADAATGMVMILATVALMALVFGPLATRTDLRSDLGSLQSLRTYPLDPRWLVATEVGAATFLISSIQILLLLAALAFVPLAGLGRFTGLTVALLVLAILVTPALTAVVVVVQNGMALLFPEWSRIGSASQAGFDQMGRMMVTFIGTAVAVMFLLIPPLLATALLHASFASVLHRWAIVPSTSALVAALWLEVALCVVWLGRRYERLEPDEAGLLS